MANAEKKLWYLSQVNLFRDLPEELLQEIATATSNMRDIAKGSYISTPHDDNQERIYFLKEGEAQIYESTSEGKKMIIDILKPGDIFGYDSIGEQTQPENIFVKANRQTTLCTMPKNDFLALLEKKPGLALQVIKELTVRLASTEGRLRDTALSNIETRLMQEFKRLATRYGKKEAGRKKIDRKFTHEELAQLVGTSRETITRALARLTEQKKVSIDEQGYFMLGDANH